MTVFTFLFLLTPFFSSIAVGAPNQRVHRSLDQIPANVQDYELAAPTFKVTTSPAAISSCLRNNAVVPSSPPDSSSSALKVISYNIQPSSAAAISTSNGHLFPPDQGALPSGTVNVKGSSAGGAFQSSSVSGIVPKPSGVGNLVETAPSGFKTSAAAAPSVLPSSASTSSSVVEEAPVGCQEGPPMAQKPGADGGSSIPPSSSATSTTTHIHPPSSSGIVSPCVNNHTIQNMTADVSLVLPSLSI